MQENSTSAATTMGMSPTTTSTVPATNTTAMSSTTLSKSKFQVWLSVQDICKNDQFMNTQKDLFLYIYSYFTEVYE